MAEFALDLDHDAIALLRRSGGDWERLGEARVDAPDLPARLKALQARAGALSHGPLKTELVIPASQVLHLEVEMEEGFEALSTEAAAEAVADAVHARTSSEPGAVAFDWLSEGRTMRAAVVSVETLEEARAFAAGYGFNPVRARARPAGDAFPEDAEFGTLAPSEPASKAAPPEPEDEALDEPADGLVDGPKDERRAAPPMAPARPEPSRPAARAPRALLLAAAVAGVVAVGSAVTLSLLPGDEGETEIAAAPPEAAPEPPSAPATSPTPEPRPFDPEPVVVPVPDAGAPEPEPEAPPAAPEPAEAPDPEPEPEPEPGLAGPSEAEDALSRYAATGIWETPPPAPPVPEAHEAGAPPTPPEGERAATVVPPPLPQPPARGEAPTALPPPPPPGTSFALGPDGRVDPAPGGAATPDGILLHAGSPPIRPPARPPETIIPEERVYQDPALAGFRPTPRPEDAPVPASPTPAAEPEGDADTAVAAGEEDDAEGEPAGRAVEEAVWAALTETTAAPLSLLPTEPAQGATPGPRAVDTAVAASLFRAAENPISLTIAGPGAVAEETAAAFAAARSLRPLPRPDDPPVATGPPVAVASVAPAAPVPTRASVARRATVENALSLNRVSLVGIFGAEGDRRALVRLPSGRFEKVKVGDRLDGGRVRSIQDGRVVYVRGGRSVTLSMPRS